MSFQSTANKLLNNFRAAGAPRLASGFDDLECMDSGLEFEKDKNGQLFCHRL